MRGRAGCWVQLGAPEPHPAPTWRFCLHVTERPRLRAEVQPFLLLSQGPVWAACWALLPEALGGSTHPPEEGTSFEKVPSRRGRSAGRTGCLCPQDGPGGHRIAVCDRRHSLRLPVGAVQTPPLNRGAEGPPGPWGGKEGR